MAEVYPDPSNGAVVLPTGHGADLANFDYDETYFTESVAAYGAQTFDPYRSSGTPHAKVTAGAFAKYGAAGKTPGLGAATAAGASATLTVDTGVTIVGVMVINNIKFSHAKLRAAVPLMFGLDNGGDLVVTWPVS